MVSNHIESYYTVKNKQINQFGLMPGQTNVRWTTNYWATVWSGYYPI